MNISVLLSREESCAQQFLALIYFLLLILYFDGLFYVQMEGVVVVAQDANFDFWVFNERMVLTVVVARNLMIVTVVWLHSRVCRLCCAVFPLSFQHNHGCKVSTLLHRPRTISGIYLVLDISYFENHLLSAVWCLL